MNVRHGHVTAAGREFLCDFLQETFNLLLGLLGFCHVSVCIDIVLANIQKVFDYVEISELFYILFFESNTKNTHFAAKLMDAGQPK